VEIEKLQTSFQALMHAVAEADESAIRDNQDTLRQQLEAMLQAAGLKGALKVDPKWAGQIVASRIHEQMGTRVKALASRIIRPESFQCADVKGEIDALSGTPPKQMKEIAAGLGHKIAGTKSLALLIGLLEKISGISSILIDRMVVESHVQKLTSLYERSIDTLPEAEIKGEIKQLRVLAMPELACIAEEFGLDRPGKKKPEILKRIESKITATYKAKVANRV
jgi:hypothetical protein